MCFEAMTSLPDTSAVGFPGKRYFQHTKLADIVGAYPMTSGLDDQAALEERQQRESFLDFLLGILDLDPSCRYWLKSHRFTQHAHASDL